MSDEGPNRLTADDYRRVTELFAQGQGLATDEQSSLMAKQLADRPDLQQVLQRMWACDARRPTTGDEEDEERETPWWPGPRDADLRAGRGMASHPLPSIEGYELLEELGRGGMGVVYKARQRQFDRIVALKMIRLGQFASTAEIQRFVKEAEAIARLQHPGIVPVYEFGSHHGEHFFTMEYVAGERFDRYLQSAEHPLSDLLEIFHEVCEAVAYCHHRGILHRDLKPSNILLDERGTAKVADFGLAKYLGSESELTQTGEVMGTPGYMAPELAEGDRASIAATVDVYALGAILYHLLTGRPPISFDSTNLFGALQLVKEHDLKPPHELNRRVPRDLETICLKCLELRPADRYPTARELADDLLRYLMSEPIQARPLTLPRRIARWARQQPTLAVTWLSLTAFYSYHLLFHYFLRPGETTVRFHRVATLVFLVWATGGAFFQRWMRRAPLSPLPVYGWATLEVVAITAFLFETDGAMSPLSVVYLLLVAASVLRARTGLVLYVTALCVVTYLIHVQRTLRSSVIPDTPTTLWVPFAISLIIVGMIQYFSLRRSVSVLSRYRAIPKSPRV